MVQLNLGDSDDSQPIAGPWYREMRSYHWFVLTVAALGWMFDCLDQQLFVLARPAAMRELLSISREVPIDSPSESLEFQVTQYSQYVTAIFLAGWATGGLIFGVMGDRIGRAKTMMVTILMYSLFTGLSAFSRSFWDFAIYRFLTGLGVGGEFAVGVALVAEVMPARARTAALTLLQMLSAFGNISAALINIQFGAMEQNGFFSSQALISSPWRAMFLVGSLPALLALVVRWKLREPERWKELRSEQALAGQLGSYRALFGNSLWRRHAFIGLALAFSGVVGLWAVGFFTPDLTKRVLRDRLTVMNLQSELLSAEQDPSATGLSALLGEYRDSAIQEKNFALAENLEELQTNWRPANLQQSRLDGKNLDQLRAEMQNRIEGDVTKWGGISSICIQVGAFFGVFAFGCLAQSIGRRPTFALAFVSAGASTAAVFWFLNDFSQLFWLVPLMGFFQLSVFAGYAFYFPELFPTHLRSTGISFCYNVGRFVAASGPLMQAKIQAWFSEVGSTPLESTRFAGVIMCLVFLIGLFVLPFAPETKGKPLPE